MNNKIVLKEYISPDDYKEIKELQRVCDEHDKTALKLEPDYKLLSARPDAGTICGINEFMYYRGQVLAGYLGVCNFGGGSPEANGMVHPEFRRQGIFTKLFELAKDEWSKNARGGVLLLCDRDSVSGRGFMETTGAVYKNSEYEMYLNMAHEQPARGDEVTFRKAVNSDAAEIARQNAVYFGGGHDVSAMIMPEEEEARGMTIYFAEIGGVTVGKVHLQIERDLGAIYGFGVLPEFRRRGYGRKILQQSILILKDAGMSKIMLQVATENENALNLYKSCGFETVSTMDYYEFTVAGSI